MIHLKQNKSIFNYRVAAILLHNNKVLLHSPDYFGFYALPGGRCEELETSEEALRRELQEEMSITESKMNLEWIVENFFNMDNEKYHEISFCYNVKLPEDSPIYKTNKYPGQEGDKKIDFVWIPIDELKNINIKPAFIPKYIKQTGKGIQHIVFKNIK